MPPKPEILPAVPSAAPLWYIFQVLLPERTMPLIVPTPANADVFAPVFVPMVCASRTVKVLLCIIKPKELAPLVLPPNNISTVLSVARRLTAKALKELVPATPKLLGAVK